MNERRNSDRDGTEQNGVGTAPPATRAPLDISDGRGYGANARFGGDTSIRSECGILTSAYKNGTVGIANATQQQRDDALAKVQGLIDRATATNNDRAMATALKLWRAYDDANLKAAEALDKAHRLDNDQATDNVQFAPIQFRGGKNVIT